jgi:hypothetical protein
MCEQMVDGLGALLGVVGGVDGADDLWCASVTQHSMLLRMLTPCLARHLVSQERLPFTATYFGSIALTLYFALGVSQSQILRSPTRVDTCVVTKYNPHIARCDRAAGSFSLVPHQLFPHGLHRPAVRCEIRHRSRRCLDEQLIHMCMIDIELSEANSPKIMIS